MQQKEHDGMTSSSAEERRQKNQRDPSSKSRSAQTTAQPINPPLLIDGLEAVRDSHC
jgi:hypothetical protein